MVHSVLHSLAAAVRRALGGVLGLLPGPPDDPAVADPLLDGIDELPPEERQARRGAWLAQMRRGRGDGNG
jgi:hypothetical protein